MNLWNLFISFFKIGLLTIGGGYAMIPVIQKDMVENKKWVNNKDFIDMLAISQTIPGALAVNMSVSVGYKLKGIKGGIAAALGTILPSFFIILIISTFFFKIREIESILKIFKGIRTAVVAMILFSFLKLLKTVEFKSYGYLVMILGIVALSGFKINPIIILLISGIGSVILNEVKKKVRK